MVKFILLLLVEALYNLALALQKKTMKLQEAMMPFLSRQNQHWKKQDCFQKNWDGLLKK